MGALLQKFTYPRNAFGSSAEDSARKALDVLNRVENKTFLSDPSDPSKLKDEHFIDMRHLFAIAGGNYDDAFITPIGTRFREMATNSPTGAWRWLLTRSLWLYTVPNGSHSHVNQPAKELGIRFNFFDLVTRLTVHLRALAAPANVLYFDELLAVLDHDENWSLSSEELHDRVLTARAELGVSSPAEHTSLLGAANLEGKYGTGRDNMNTIFKKAFPQTGLFSLMTVQHNKIVGLYLDPGAYTEPVLGRRLRFVLDNPREFIE
ncbi:hypothetical protein ABQF33_17345 [Mycolicibacterium sp. XJ2]